MIETSYDSDTAPHEPEVIANRFSVLDLDLADVPKDELLEYVYKLKEWVDDPSGVAWGSTGPSRIQKGLTGTGEDYLAIFALRQLREVADKGETFLARAMANGVRESLMGKFFEEGYTVPMHKATLRHLNPKSSEATLFDGSQLAAIRQFLVEKENTGEIFSADSFMERVSEPRHGQFIMERNVIDEQLTQLEEQGYLDSDSAWHDGLLLGNLALGNIYSANYRIWHMAYAMPEEEIKESVSPYSFMMKAYGEVDRNRVDGAFYEKFIGQEEIDYKDIVKNGLAYSPVWMAPNTIGFFEETGHLVEMFDVSQANPDDPGSVIKIDLDSLVAENLPLYSATEAEGVRDVFYQVGCALEARHVIETCLGLKLKEVSLGDQVAIVHLLHRATPSQMKAIIPHGVDTIVQVARSLEFGDDFGDAILDIAEHTTSEQAERIFENINSLRTRTSEFANMFDAIDPVFARATEAALNERITDALTALQEVARQGYLHKDVAPHQKNADYVHDGSFDIDVSSIDGAMEILDGLEKTLSLIHGIVVAQDLKISKVNSNEAQFVQYRLMSEQAGNMLVYVRPEGAYGYDKDVEYGNRKGVEASISFMVNPLDPHALVVPKDIDAVSIRFDHEGRLVDEAPDSDRRDPTRRDGLISVDVSSGMGKVTSLPVRIGRFIAAGNRIRADRQGTEDSLHHNTHYFDQEKYGDADGFAHLARGVIRQIELMKKTLHSKKMGTAVDLTVKAAEIEQSDLRKAA